MASCTRPQEHHLHLCELRSSLSRAELNVLMQNPKYVCANCGDRMHSGRNLCIPKRIRN
jgi:hypothetical protein